MNSENPIEVNTSRGVASSVGPDKRGFRHSVLLRQLPENSHTPNLS